MNDTILPAQIRAARSLLNWLQDDLARAAGVALTSVRDIEGEKRSATSGTSASVRRALENAGVEFIGGTSDHGPGVRWVVDRPHLVRRPTVMTMWEGMPIEVSYKGGTFDAFISREVLDDLGRLTKNEPDDVYFGIFDRYRAEILDGVRNAFDDAKNWDKQGRLYVRGKDIDELNPAIGPKQPNQGSLIMTRHDRLIEHVHRLSHVIRCIMLKRALTAAEPKPHLNFWRLIYGNQLDIAVIEWCKIFGSDSEATHWKKIVPIVDHGRFRTDLLDCTGITESTWASYWNEIKTYRDNLAAHHNSTIRVPNYPTLDVALKSSYFYYRFVIGELRQLHDTQFPDDLEVYSIEFESLAREAAKKAIAATRALEERVM